jgi:hypothetical protein
MAVAVQTEGFFTLNRHDAFLHGSMLAPSEEKKKSEKPK